MEIGTLVKWKAESAYGFIRPDDGSPNVFAHLTTFQGEHWRIKKRRRVAFERTWLCGKAKWWQLYMKLSPVPGTRPALSAVEAPPLALGTPRPAVRTKLQAVPSSTVQSQAESERVAQGKEEASAPAARPAPGSFEASVAMVTRPDGPGAGEASAFAQGPVPVGTVQSQAQSQGEATTKQGASASVHEDELAPCDFEGKLAQIEAALFAALEAEGAADDGGAAGSSGDL